MFRETSSMYFLLLQTINILNRRTKTIPYPIFSWPNEVLSYINFILRSLSNSVSSVAVTGRGLVDKEAIANGNREFSFCARPDRL